MSTKEIIDKWIKRHRELAIKRVFGTSTASEEQELDLIRQIFDFIESISKEGE